MKKFTKLFLSCAAVAALTAAVATSALADEVAITGGVTGNYNTETGMITITAPEGMDAGSQATLLVYDGAATATEINANSVVGIDQEAGAAFKNSGLKDKPQKVSGETKQYTVKLGYYKSGTFTVLNGTLSLGDVVGTDIIVGDADLNGNVRASDANAVLWYSVGSKPVEGKTYNVGDTFTTADGKSSMVGDADLNSNVRASDANAVLWYSVGTKPVDGKTYNVGETITVTMTNND